MMITSKNEALNEAIAEFQTLKAFSESVGVDYQVVQQWQKNRVPAEYCPVIERVTNRKITCERLRPDVDWPYLRECAQPSDDHTRRTTDKQDKKH